MKLHRFILPFEVAGSQVTVTDEEAIGQIRNVLRLKTGDQVLLCDGQGQEALVQISDLRKDEIVAEIVKISENNNEPATEVTLYCSLLKRENFEWVCQKATEIGVSRIVPLLSARTVKLQLNRSRIEKIIKEAAEQSGRGKLPVLEEPLEFPAALEDAKNNDANFFFDASGAALEKKTVKSIGVFIGPEGGWEPEEIALATENGFTLASLGPTTLRGETAAVVASYLAVR